MKRRTFIRISAATASTVFFPILNCSSELNQIELLAKPISLSDIITAESIVELGEYYQKQIPDESNKNILISLLLRNYDGKNISESSDNLLIQNSLKHRIKQDFVKNKIIVIDGWILSKTEARQCALYSLIYN
jgi:hypothetical protein